MIENLLRRKIEEAKNPNQRAALENILARREEAKPVKPIAPRKLTFDELIEIINNAKSFRDVQDVIQSTLDVQSEIVKR